MTSFLISIGFVLLVCLLAGIGTEIEIAKYRKKALKEKLELEIQRREEVESELKLLKRIESLRVESMKIYGVDISSDWDKTATSKTAALEQAYLRGRADERKRYEEIMNEDRPACCIEHDVYGATCDTCEYWLDED